MKISLIVILKYLIYKYFKFLPGNSSDSFFNLLKYLVNLNHTLLILQHFF